MSRSFIVVLFALINFSFVNSSFSRDFYAITVYKYSTRDQETRLEAYLREAYLPALHRVGIGDVGVFKPVDTEENEEKQLYVFTPFKSEKEFFGLEVKLNKDEQYLSASKVYRDAAFDHPSYDRKEVILLNAFTKHPHYTLPELSSPKADRIYELRSYESATEKLYWNKVKMFNEGDEVGLFKKLGFNAVFYGEVVSGNRMPNLMYLTTFDNKASRDEHWEAFDDDPHWKMLSAKAEYQNNVSKIDIIFLYPTAYSDI